METLLLDLQRGSLHDGPGVRATVFLKGCPLRCQWCHNPESQGFSRELSFNRSRCASCGACAAVCPHGVHAVAGGAHTVDFSRCRFCGACVEACSQKALSIVGRAVSPKEAFKEVERDRVFYETTGGGVTLSGGEPLCHACFCEEFLRLCREGGIHTCIETSGLAPREAFERLLPLVDLWLYDYKITPGDQRVWDFIGAEPQQALENLAFLCSAGRPVILRCPLIPGVNDTEPHFSAICGLLAQYGNILHAELLPYHDFGVIKAQNTGKQQTRFAPPSEEQKAGWLAYFQARGARAVFG